MPTNLDPSVLSSEYDIYAPMPTRPLGSFGWNASALTLGGVKWDTDCTDKEAIALVQRAYELGVNTFDTAHIYGDGESERKLGLAIEDFRDKIWLNTKIMDRTYDGAMKLFDISMKRLGQDCVDLLFVHSLDDQQDFDNIFKPNSVLKAVEEIKASGRAKHIGVSGHWVKDLQAKIIQDYPFEAVLSPGGLFNLAYNYNFVDTVLPIAKAKGMATFGMKVFGVGRVKHAASIYPYLQYSLHLPFDTLIIGMDSIAQLEQTIGIIKSMPEALSVEDQVALFPECLAITQEWDKGEYPWVNGYPKLV